MMWPKTLKERLVIDMKLKVGDIVKFKNCEDMTAEEQSGVPEETFPKYGKIAEIINDNFFYIEDYGYLFNQKSVVRVLGEGKRFNPGDEVLVKATVRKAFDGYLQIDEIIDGANVIKVLKHAKPDCFIVQEKYYGLYIGDSGDLVSDKDRAHIYTSREDADNDASATYLSRWDVIPYGN